MNKNDINGVALELEDSTVNKWAAILAKAAWIVLVTGAILGLVFWFTIGHGTVGYDIGALTWCITGGLLLAIMSARQILLAERR